MADLPARKGIIHAELDAIKARLADLEEALGALLDAKPEPKKREPKKAQKEPE